MIELQDLRDDFVEINAGDSSKRKAEKDTKTEKTEMEMIQDPTKKTESISLLVKRLQQSTGHGDSSGGHGQGSKFCTYCGKYGHPVCDYWKKKNEECEAIQNRILTGSSSTNPEPQKELLVKKPGLGSNVSFVATKRLVMNLMRRRKLQPGR